MSEEQKVTTKKVTQPVEKYSVQDLIENCEALTGYKKEVAVGALFNSKEDEMSKDDFKKAITNFLKKEVK
ncbi:hypothetical protein G8S49_11105 [Clostridium botulinum C]|uniref:YqzN/YkzM domain-containing protein n=2 Tax=Clostridium botulinum TaxID=1491 RepID=A0A9Q4XZP3_CLOBO|nr:hypothetical protein [Clostridium botulinum]KMJ93084.1 hypothetical protein CBCST_22735 [Clostridium botulinum C str. Stockholm]MCD3195700.1 hypothetical protein [Clostridium botulinum C]MCD3201116.1 hypothetical protein [Clostridium botulinum C]MCD3206632.1 hypothetical protein [Clostridium botulinum C]MCD3209369.1 hypothetical protein [Clostridium botulinum C]